MKHHIILTRLALIALAMLIAVPSAMAYSFEAGGIYYQIYGDNVYVTYKDTSFNSYSGQVNIPSTVAHEGKSYTVEGVDECAFLNCSDLTGVNIPSTVTVLDNSSFSHCYKLASITIPNSVTKIGSEAFECCI